ncbi:OpgC domain-containing protein, partial [Acinetobacter baumannii]|uniref:OpgC domain-containing protein n=1 Tax=Acinetobacter baumannii TaxID=470 RepID=UPI001487ECBE
LRPLIICGKRSLEVFCVGVFLSFAGHFVIELVSDSIPFQILVRLAGIAVMTTVAYYRPWTTDLRSSPSKRVSA